MMMMIVIISVYDDSSSNNVLHVHMYVECWTCCVSTNSQLDTLGRPSSARLITRKNLIGSSSQYVCATCTNYLVSMT